MGKLAVASKTSLILAVIAVQVAFWPMAAYAQEAPSPESVPDSTVSQTETVEPVPETPVEPVPEPIIQPPEPQGPTQPPGPERSKYVYNPETGMWENDYYAWDPVTKQTKPLTEKTYSFNPETGMWDTTEWHYRPETGRYEAQTVSVSNPPAGSTISNTGPDSDNTIDSDGTLNTLIDGTGPNSSNSILLTTDGEGIFDLYFNVSISHTLNSTATSGDASVLQNTTGGNALTGDATAMANILNMLQSSWGLGGQDIATFISNIDGDVVGDLYIDPGQIPANNLAVENNPLEGDLTVNVAVDAEINNDINLAAASGDATVAGNTTGGNATSGEAYALANVINMINSVVAAGQSFIGTININGSLTGDILLPDWLNQEIIASNISGDSEFSGLIDSTGPGSNNTINQTSDGSLDMDIDTNHLINNAISATATSGNAIVTDNTTAGDATSGDASTNITLLNLTGHHVSAKNSLLVFVNVMGEWVGLIVDAPAGATSAAIGDGVTNISQILPNGDTEINATTNSRINNNIEVNAASGDATVAHNTIGGNATSGDATASANVLNIVNTQFNLSDWFGVLFINVLGTWHGSFGIDTAYGNAPPTVGGSGSGSTTHTTAAVNSGGVPQMFRFVPGSSTSSDRGLGASEAAATADEENNPMVLAATGSSDSQPPVSFGSSSSAAAQPKSFLWITGMTGLFSLLLFGGERLLLVIRKPRVL